MNKHKHKHQYYIDREYNALCCRTCKDTWSDPVRGMSHLIKVLAKKEPKEKKIIRKFLKSNKKFLNEGRWVNDWTEYKDGRIEVKCHKIPPQPKKSTTTPTQETAKTGHITIDPEVRGGKPCFEGTRITITELDGYIVSGWSVNKIVKNFPSIDKEALIDYLGLTTPTQETWQEEFDKLCEEHGEQGFMGQERKPSDAWIFCANRDNLKNFISTLLQRKERETREEAVRETKNDFKERVELWMATHSKLDKTFSTDDFIKYITQDEN